MDHDGQAIRLSKYGVAAHHQSFISTISRTHTPGLNSKAELVQGPFDNASSFILSSNVGRPWSPLPY